MNYEVLNSEGGGPLKVGLSMGGKGARGARQ